MRSARKNIGEHSANPSSLPAAGRPDEAVSHSRWRHIGTYIVSFSNVLGPVSDGWSVPFSLGEFLVEGPLLADRTRSSCARARTRAIDSAGTSDSVLPVGPHAPGPLSDILLRWTPT